MKKQEREITLLDIAFCWGIHTTLFVIAQAHIASGKRYRFSTAYGEKFIVIPEKL